MHALHADPATSKTRATLRTAMTDREGSPDTGGDGRVFEVRDLSCWYGDKQALRSINLDVPERQVTAFIGPSGCGKSTFLRCMNRMNDLIPSARVQGRLLYRGHDIYA